MEILSLFEAGAGAITLAQKFMEMVEKSTNEGDTTSFTEIVNSLKLAAVEMCRSGSSELRRMRTEFRQSHIDTTKTIDQLYDDLKWYNFMTKSQIRRSEQKFHEIYQTLTAFIDDVTAVLICANQTNKLSDPFKSAYDTKKQLDGLVNSNSPVDKIIDEMLKINDIIIYRLKGGSAQIQ